MFRLLIFLLFSILFFSCGEVSKVATASKEKFNSNGDKKLSLPLDKKVFIGKCNEYLMENKNVSEYLLNYLCNQHCGYSCLNLYHLRKDETLLNRALEYMSNECENNIKSSCLILGDYFLKDNKPDKAKSYFIKGCNLNSGEACYKLSLINKSPVDEFLLKSCNLGFFKACFNLGAYYYKQKDFDKSVKFLEKSCEKNLLKACYLLSKIYLKDKKDIDMAIQYLDKSCKLNSSSACLYIGYMYYSGKEVKKDKNKALKYFKYACDNLKSSKGCSLTGIIYYRKRDYINSVCYLNRGCSLKDGSGCLSLSLLLIKGEIFNKNPRLAMDYLKLAKKYGVDRDILNYLCKSGLKAACKEEEE